MSCVNIEEKSFFFRKSHLVLINRNVLLLFIKKGLKNENA